MLAAEASLSVSSENVFVPFTLVLNVLLAKVVGEEHLISSFFAIVIMYEFLLLLLFFRHFMLYIHDF